MVSADVSLRVDRSSARLLALIVLGASTALAYSGVRPAIYLMAAATAYATILITIERAVPRARAVGHLWIEEGVVVAGEPFRISASIALWMVPLMEVYRVALEGDSGVSISEVKTAKVGCSLDVEVWTLCRVGTHMIDGLQIYARTRALAMTLRIRLTANVIVRALPKLDGAGLPRGAGAPLDIGLSSVGRPGPGSQFYMSREYRPGDDLRRIDWKASSRTGKLAVKVFEREVYRRVILVVPITERYLVGFSGALDDLAYGIMRAVSELVRLGTEVIVALISRTYEPIPAFVRVRNADEVSDLAVYFSHVSWGDGVVECRLEYRSALWASVKVLADVATSRSVVVYLGEPESDVDVVAGRIVADIVRSMGHEPVFAIVTPELLRVSRGEASAEDLVRLARTAGVALSDLSKHAKVVHFNGEDLLHFILRATAA